MEREHRGESIGVGAHARPTVHRISWIGVWIGVLGVGVSGSEAGVRRATIGNRHVVSQSAPPAG